MIRIRPGYTGPTCILFEMNQLLLLSFYFECTNNYANLSTVQY